ncbi:helix-turn-helix transcriptional regulator [Nocardioides sp. HDW12B]|uniref:LuxR C-terminal-related transcriptional regulator n=1 Tax=Nocardioides sp. HDW12B TaxID=2714939 RepID=UPI00140AC655|nr:LuxR C-terminal-related transcriptional regulator [Nocardioides sp. HDW12B]QIK67311.1 helix-turn-helix transcriptional regulator [Nocardioides sp. HDW12B]
MAAVVEDLRAGARAMEQARWLEARTAYERVLDTDPSPEQTGAALEGLGQALWFLGEVAAGITARERAFTEYAAARACGDAARVAVWVSHQHLTAGRTSAARGWLARAERALEHVPECSGHGWVAVERARHATDVEEQVGHCERALDVARRTGAEDLEVFALSLLGRAETAAGRRERGMGLLEEAMAAATSGVVRNVHTLAEAYCNLVMACTNAGEWERAAEWCEHVEEFARTHETAPLWGACRSVHAEVLLARGHWAEAETALTAALETAGRFVPGIGEPAIASLAELRVAQGRLAEAEQLLTGRSETASALRSLALLRIADGRPAVAVELLTRGLRAAGGDVMRTAQLLAALVDAHLAVGDAPSAGTAAARLDALADSTGIHLVRARGALASARVFLGSGPTGAPGAAEDAEGAAGGGVAEGADGGGVRSAGADAGEGRGEGRGGGAVEDVTRCAARRAAEALALFESLVMPLEVAESRLELARASVETSPEVAAEEADAALATFRELGAVAAERRAESVLAGLRSPGLGGRGPMSTGAGVSARGAAGVSVGASAGVDRVQAGLLGRPLTAREREVLELVARGRSNAAIARELVISEKTAGHHVSHILAKLGARNRAEAAAMSRAPSPGS